MVSYPITDTKAPYYQRALIVAPSKAHDIISAKAPRAYKIRDFRDGSSPATFEKMRFALNAQGYRIETKFDAAHGRRYLAIVYSDATERRKVIETYCGPLE